MVLYTVFNQSECTHASLKYRRRNHNEEVLHLVSYCCNSLFAEANIETLTDYRTFISFVECGSVFKFSLLNILQSSTHK